VVSFNTIGKYDANTGATINASFASAGSNVSGIVPDGSGDLFVTSGTNPGYIHEFNATTGAMINVTFVTGLNTPQYLAIVPEPSTFALTGLCATGLLARRRGHFRP
jgi:PEP-CTERM motif/PGF-CTERM motif